MLENLLADFFLRQVMLAIRLLAQNLKDHQGHHLLGKPGMLWLILSSSLRLMIEGYLS